MTEPIHVPSTACGTCPYRRDVPSGIWSADEYQKLPEYDEPEFDRENPVYKTPPIAVFHCHQENATGKPTVCRGWLSTHRDVVAVRLGVATGAINPNDIPTADESETYYGSGAEACEAGLQDIAEPSNQACRRIDTLIRRGAGKSGDE